MNGRLFVCSPSVTTPTALQIETMSDPKTVRSPTGSERQTLEAMTREAVGRVAMRAQMILLSSRGYSAPRIAEIHEVVKVTVYKWINRFDEHGPEGLYDQDREGRPRKLGPDAEAELERVLDQPPPEEDQDASRWTAPRLARHLEEELCVEVHPDTVRRALQRLEYSWKRPRRVLPKPSGWKERLAEIERQIQQTGAETTVLFEDSGRASALPAAEARVDAGWGAAPGAGSGSERQVLSLRGIGRREWEGDHRGVSEGQDLLHGGLLGDDPC